MQKIKIIVVVVGLSVSSVSRCMEELISTFAAQVRVESNRRLFNAAQEGNFKSVQTLIPISDLNARHGNVEFSALRQAAQNGHFNVVVALVNANADVNIKDADGGTPLSIACETGKFNIVDFLLKNGAKEAITMKSKPSAGGMSPLRQAAQNNHIAVTDLLLKNGAESSVDILDEQGMTPLFVASSKGHSECAALLIGAKAGVNISNKRGFTPLHSACVLGQKGIVALLLQSKADQTLKDDTGQTPLDCAKRSLDLVTQLREIVRASKRQRVHDPERELPAEPEDEGGEKKEADEQECAV